MLDQERWLFTYKGPVKPSGQEHSKEAKKNSLIIRRFFKEDKFITSTGKVTGSTIFTLAFIKAVQSKFARRTLLVTFVTNVTRSAAALTRKWITS